jgi:hypothetical protein
MNARPVLSQNQGDIENNCDEMMADGKCQIIYEGHDCECFESKKPKLPEGIIDVISL